jgi:hypothetical protein
MSVTADSEFERALIEWRDDADLIEQSELDDVFCGLYDDYLTATAALAAVLTRYANLEELMSSWQHHTLRRAVERLCIPPRGRGMLLPEVLEGAAYWRRFRQLIANATSD